MAESFETKRLKLHQELLECTEVPCYYQPPENLKLDYPCIVYELEIGKSQHADNKHYLWTDCYRAVLIHRDPDTEIPRKLRDHFEYIATGSRYKADNLYHDPFTIHY